MKTMGELISNAMTEMQAPRMPRPEVNTMALAKALTFNLDGDEKNQSELKRMIEAAGWFIKGVDDGTQPFWVSYLGKSGAGKTYLSKKIWRWYRNSRNYAATFDGDNIIYPGSFVFWPDLAAQLLGNKGYGELEDLGREKLVVLDELGSDRDPSGHVRDCLARLLSSRVGKWTIITSNKDLGDIERDIDTRISSRMIRDGNVVVDVDVMDYSLRIESTATQMARATAPDP